MILRKYFNYASIKQHLPIFLVLCIAITLRFYNFSNRITMGVDSARDAFVSLEGARLFQMPLTGPFISIAPVTTGPWYWIQLILFRLIIPTNYAPWLLLATYSVFMVVVMYYIGILLEGARFGLILALITTFAQNQIQVATELTNPSVIGFYTALIILLFIVLVKRGPSNRLGLLLGLIFGITLNTHYQTAGLISLLVAFLFFGKKYISTLVQVCKGVFITFLPLLYFELNNHWYNTRHMLRYILVDQYNIWTPMRWLTYVNDFWPRFIAFVLGGEKLFGFTVMTMIVFVFFVQMIRRKWTQVYYFLFLSFLIQVIIIRYYRGEKFFGYLQFFHPYLILFTGYVINWVYQFRHGRFFGFAVILLYLLMVMPSSINRWQSDVFTNKVHRLTKNMYEVFGPGPFKIYKCQSSTNWDIAGIVLQLDMDKKYSSTGKPLIYKWGCSFPYFRHDGTRIYQEEAQEAEKLFPKFENLFDVSIASPAALLAVDWVEASPAGMYQSSARWWMDEQPYRAE